MAANVRQGILKPSAEVARELLWEPFVVQVLHELGAKPIQALEVPRQLVTIGGGELKEGYESRGVPAPRDGGDGHVGEYHDLAPGAARPRSQADRLDGASAGLLSDAVQR